GRKGIRRWQTRMSERDAIRSAPRNPLLSSLSGLRSVTPGLFFFAALVIALPTVPYLFPVSTDVASSAAAAGYSNRVAFQVAMTILTVCAAAFALVSRYGSGVEADPRVRPGVTAGPEVAPAWKSGAIRIPELVAVFVGAGLLYLPWALAETGPFTE